MKTRSVRHFKPDPVSRETWNVLRRAAEYSQSGLNAQSIRLTAVEDPDTLSGIRKALLRMYDKLERLAAFPVTRLAARLALSPQDYHAVISETATQPLRRQAEERGEDPVLYGAPALLLLTGPASQTAREDATVLSHNIMMALTALGLGSCYMGGLVLGCRVSSTSRFSAPWICRKATRSIRPLCWGRPPYSSNACRNGSAVKSGSGKLPRQRSASCSS